jgi:hypothetical protein
MSTKLTYDGARFIYLDSHCSFFFVLNFCIGSRPDGYRDNRELMNEDCGNAFS